MNTSLEPISLGATQTVTQAESIVKKSGAVNGRITVDLLHFMRTGSTMTDISALTPGIIGSVQICDGPARMDDPDRLIEEAANERMVPGEGDFPLVEFLRNIPADISLGIEVPLRSRRESGMTALDRSRLVVSATRAVQSLASK